MKFDVKTDREFKKDLARDKKCGLYQARDFKKLTAAIDALVEDTPLEPTLLDHPLKGNWRSYRERHIKPNWLLVYKTDRTSMTLKLARLGTHNQIFNQ